MTRQEYTDHVERLHLEAVALNRKKSQDYTGTSDPFDTFTQTSIIAGIKPEQYLLGLLAMKLVRIRTVLEAEHVNFESVTDSCIDVSNYALILDAYITSKK